MPPFIAELVITEDALDKLWGHGLRDWQALQMLEESPKFTLQANGRIRAVGPDRGGGLITLILEYPDAAGRSELVTGWPSDNDEQTRYHRPGGWTND